MSLKTFHIIFVIATTLLSVFLAVWGFKLAPVNVGDLSQKIGYAGIAGMIIMPLYGVYFYKKAKNIIL